MERYQIFWKKGWKRPVAFVLTAVLAVSSVTALESRLSVQAKTVERTGYILSKAAGTYQDKVEVKITAKKGYKVYYSLNGTLSIKKLVKSGASRTVTIKKTKTLSVYAVKSQEKVKKATLQKKAVLKKIKTYRYLIEDVTIKAGTADIPLGHNGITAKTELETKNADISIYSVGDGLKTTYDSDDNKNQESPFEPVLKVTGGTLVIESSDGDGISASYTLNKGTTEEKSYGKAVLAPASAYIRTKAANADSSTADDAVHSNGDITITGGTLTLSAADDGIHADGTLTIQNGTITVTSSYEGLEGNDILISGGTMNITASDDGLNAAGGSDSGNASQDSFVGNPFGGPGGVPGGTNSQNQTASSNSEGSYKGIKAGSSLLISGGEITVDTLSTGTKSNMMDFGMMNQSDTNHSLKISGGSLTVFAEGDGIDSNGSLYISGGTVVVYGPSNGGNGALDIGDDSGFCRGRCSFAGRQWNVWRKSGWRKSIR